MEHKYKVKGMHCASCEILIEKKLLDLDEVKSVDASTDKGEVVVQLQGSRPSPERLNKLFKEENYTFSDFEEKKVEPKQESTSSNPTLVAFNFAIFIIIGFLLLDWFGAANFLSMNSESSLLAFLGFGLLAGVSSCAALVGGIVLSMSKQWQGLYAEKLSTTKKLQPHIMFNSGRVISYAIVGGLLGVIGNRLQISIGFTALLIICVSILMIALGLQMLGVKAFRRFQIVAPKSITREIADENNFQGKYMPFLMGALTVFLPCGFTITTEGLALLSGSAVSGALIMGAFALGTVPMLFIIGLSSVKFFSKPHSAAIFSKVAGFLVIFFALYNISNQMNVLGFTGFNFSQSQTVNVKEDGLAPIVNGKQVLKMTATGSKDTPNYFKVKAGIPVRWEITAGDSLGCNGAIIARGLFSDTIDLTPGKLSIKEFTPKSPGKYRFSCTMGMIVGTIEVVGSSSESDNSGNIKVAGAQDVNPSVNSGSGGCGCGGGTKTKQDSVPTVASLQANTQIINSTYSASKYLSPNSFEVKAGTPVKLTIDVKDNGSGCGSAIKIPGLYDNAQPLIAGNKIVINFTPKNSGNYDITCSMGMIHFGSIRVN